MDLDVTIFA